MGSEEITLAVTDSVTVGDSQKLQNSGGSFNFIGGLTIGSGGEILAQGQQISGNIDLDGGQIIVEENTVLSDDLSQSADSIISFETSKTLTYEGSTFNLDTSKLKMLGGGIFSNTVDSLISLNNSDSHLVLDNVSVGYISASAESSSAKGIEVTADSSITSLSLTDKIILSVATSKNFEIVN